MKEAHHNATETLTNKTESLVDLLNEQKEWLRHITSGTKFKLPGLTDEQVEERMEIYEYNLVYKIKDTKELIEYYKDKVRYFVSFRQQNLKNVLKYHKLCRDFEYSRIELLCDGKVDKFTFDASKQKPEEVIEGPSEIVRVGTKALKETYMDRQNVITKVLRWGSYFK
tara:strand:+ start:808 stop:1311 length:504 start_codon:yes stop_codon:yes gene_type:complete